MTLLFDTGIASKGPLAADLLAGRKGWAAVPEDTLNHAFIGDAVFMNDRVAVVLRRGAGTAEVYSRAGAGFKQRATLTPIDADASGAASAQLKILENSQASVMLEAAFSGRTKSPIVCRFRLSAGEGLLDVRGGEGLNRLRVGDQAQYVVVPDFFADDMVFDPAADKRNRIGLPAENSLLGLSDDGKAIVACVWPSTRQNVDLLLSGEGSRRAIDGYEIDLNSASRLWLAVMEGEGIWHAERLPAGQPAAEFALKWKPPMPARWRSDFVNADGVGISTYFNDPQSGPEPENAKSNGSCRLDGGRAMVRMIDAIQSASPRLMAVYPIERTRTTPLTAFCLVDIMRNALGFGPCQYVLDAEGLGNSESPTPDQVTRWVEKQFEKKPSKRDVDGIGDLLGKMAQQVRKTDARIADYAQAAGRIKQACARDADRTAGATLAKIADQMLFDFKPAHATVEKLAHQAAALADAPDALPKTRQALADIRTAGASQDYALGKLRMAARRLKQECRTLIAADPKSADLARRIEQQSEQMLVKK